MYRAITTTPTTGPNPVGQKFQGTLLLWLLDGPHSNTQAAPVFRGCVNPITIKFADDIAYLMNVFLATGKDFRLHERLRDTPQPGRQQG